MLLGLQVEPGRSGPAEAALVGTGAPPGVARVEMLGPFPAVFDSEDRAQILHPLMQRAGPARPTPLVGIVWIPEEVVVAIRFFGQLGHVAMIAMDRAEA